MEKVVYNPIMDKNYIGIVTVLNYKMKAGKAHGFNRGMIGRQ